jgi:hypothetical protein
LSSELDEERDDDDEEDDDVDEVEKYISGMSAFSCK